MDPLILLLYGLHNQAGLNQVFMCQIKLLFSDIKATHALQQITGRHVSINRRI